MVDTSEGRKYFHDCEHPIALKYLTLGTPRCKIFGSFQVLVGFV
jgi:hypothetical protein